MHLKKSCRTGPNSVCIYVIKLYTKYPYVYIYHWTNFPGLHASSIIPLLNNGPSVSKYNRYSRCKHIN